MPARLPELNINFSAGCVCCLGLSVLRATTVEACSRKALQVSALRSGGKAGPKLRACFAQLNYKVATMCKRIFCKYVKRRTRHYIMWRFCFIVSLEILIYRRSRWFAHLILTMCPENKYVANYFDGQN